MRRTRWSAESPSSAPPSTSVTTPVSILLPGTGIHACWVLLMPFQISSGQDVLRDVLVLATVYTGLLSGITLAGLLAFAIKGKEGKAESAAVVTASLTASVPYFGIPATLLLTEPISLPLLVTPLAQGLFGYFLQWISMRIFIVFRIHATVRVLAVVLPIVLICLQVFWASRT